mgnify:CR=1 FL=1
MFLKSINNVIGYKDLPDGFCAEFDEKKTYIVGANFQRKTTVGSLFNWCMTGTTLNGKEKESVANDTKKDNRVVVDITFVDNFGIEHKLVREKSKEIHLILDGKEVKQEYLSQFYKDKDIFLVVYNPYYFWTLEPKEQKDLIRKILPVINAKDVFNLLTEYERNLIKKPIDGLNSYNEQKNKEIDLLKKEYDINSGRIETLKKIALEKEGDLLTFEKEEELTKLQSRFDEISMNMDNYNLENITISIESLNRRIKNIIEDDLSKISKQYERENNKLKETEKEKTICSYCMQEIKDNEAKENLKKFIKKEMNNLQEKADKLKEDAKGLLELKKEKQNIFDKLNTQDMKQLQIEKDNLKQKIDELQKEKNEILFHNQEVKIRIENVKNAKEALESCEKANEEIQQKIEINKEQKKVINKLRILTIETQKEKIEKYLNKVNIEFSKLVKTTGEIAECCNIQYDGRDYKKLSKSQQARACLEISNVFNNISGIKAPIFFDDAESTTDIPEIPETQIIISLVIKYNKLEILYDYEDVLERRKKSIKREIEEKDCYEIPMAA